MTHLRKMMLEELQRRNYSENTTRCYLRTVEDFARRFNCSPDRLGPRHIREYQAELFEKRKLSAGSVAVRLAALRFFYCKTLNRAWSIADTTYPKGAHRLPAILSQECVSTGAGYSASPAHGCFQATAGIPVIRRSTPRWCGTLARKPPSERASRKMFILTRFVTVLPRIYSRMGLTCAPFRSC
jgi:integrase/recombinase XerD